MPPGAQFVDYRMDASFVRGALSPDSSDIEVDQEKEFQPFYSKQQITKPNLEKPAEKVTEKLREYTQEEMAELMTVDIMETETFTLFHIPAKRIVSMGTENQTFEHALAFNADYRALCDSRGAQKDKYASSAVQALRCPCESHVLSSFSSA
jgi:hypothetical protein